MYTRAKGGLLKKQSWTSKGNQTAARMNKVSNIEQKVSNMKRNEATWSHEAHEMSKNEAQRNHIRS